MIESPSKSIVVNPYVSFADTDGYELSESKCAITQIIESGLTGSISQNFQIVGLPGMGKSLIIDYLASLIERNHDEKRLIVIRANCRDWLDDPLRELLNHTREALKQRIGINWEETLPSASRHAMSELLALTKQVASANYRLIVLLDDFDNVMRSITEEEANNLRYLQDQVAFLLSLERPLVTLNESIAYSSPFFNQFLREDLLPFNPMEAHWYATEPARRVGVSMPAEDIAFVLNQTNGFPVLIKTACRELFDYRSGFNNDRGPLSSSEQSIRIVRWQSQTKPYLQRIWRRLQNDEQILLAKISNGQNPEDHINTAAGRQLQERGLLVADPASNQFSIAGELLASFARDVKPEPTPQITELKLSDLERNLLQYLIQHEGAICTFQELLENVWHVSKSRLNDQEKGRIHTAVWRLNGKLKDIPQPIGQITKARGIGYQWRS